MKIVKTLRKATRQQISKLHSRETAHILTTFAVSPKTTVKSAIGSWRSGDVVIGNAHLFEIEPALPKSVSVQHANIGTTVRPEQATIVNGAETVESFLARGGSIKTAKPTKVPVPTIRCKGSRNMANTMMKGTRSVKSIEEVK